MWKCYFLPWKSILLPGHFALVLQRSTCGWDFVVSSGVCEHFQKDIKRHFAWQPAMTQPLSSWTATYGTSSNWKVFAGLRHVPPQSKHWPGECRESSACTSRFAFFLQEQKSELPICLVNGSPFDHQNHGESFKYWLINRTVLGAVRRELVVIEFVFLCGGQCVPRSRAPSALFLSLSYKVVRYIGAEAQDAAGSGQRGHWTLDTERPNRVVL